MNIIQRFFDDLKKMNSSTTENRHDRRRRKATYSVQRTDGKPKYETPGKLHKAGRQIKAERERE
jgi:hypothetical protein